MQQNRQRVPYSSLIFSSDASGRFRTCRQKTCCEMLRERELKEVIGSVKETPAHDPSDSDKKKYSPGIWMTLSPEEREERNRAIKERFTNGETLAVISKDFGLNKETIRKICYHVERKIKPKWRRKPDDPATIK